MLSAGAIVGIVLAVIAALLFILCMIYQEQLKKAWNNRERLVESETSDILHLYGRLMNGVINIRNSTGTYYPHTMACMQSVTALMIMRVHVPAIVPTCIIHWLPVLIGSF